MAVNTLKCNHLTQLHFKELNDAALVAILAVGEADSITIRSIKQCVIDSAHDI